MSAVVTLKPANDDVFKMLTWARDQILKYGNFEMTDHFNRRLVEDGRAAWSEVREVIQHGTCCSARPHPRYFVGILEYKDLIVVIGSNKDAGKPTLLTCYYTIDSDRGWEQFLDEHIDINRADRVPARVKVNSLEISDEELEAEVARRRLTRRQSWETRLATVTAKLARLNDEVRMLDTERAELESKLKGL
jgi:hypothetical protein